MCVREAVHGERESRRVCWSWCVSVQRASWLKPGLLPPFPKEAVCCYWQTERGFYQSACEHISAVECVRFLERCVLACVSATEFSCLFSAAYFQLCHFSGRYGRRGKRKSTTDSILQYLLSCWTCDSQDFNEIINMYFVVEPSWYRIFGANVDTNIR